MKSEYMKHVLLAGLLAGTMDITAAIIQTLAGGGYIVRLFQYIASGVFGKAAFEGGYAMASAGLIFHYVIAMVWTVFYFSIYRRVTFFHKHWIISAVIYGAFVWLIMNRVVLPLSNINPFPFSLSRSVLAMGILMVCIGGPVAYLAKRHFKRAEN